MAKKTEKQAEAKAKTPKSRRKSEEDIRAEYPDVIEGSLMFVTPEMAANDETLAKWSGKQTVERPCERTGKQFRLATSDLHQTRFHPEERAKAKRERLKAKRAEKKAEKTANEEAA